jgi:hypothetical protein
MQKLNNLLSAQYYTNDLSTLPLIWHDSPHAFDIDLGTVKLTINIFKYHINKMVIKLSQKNPTSINLTQAETIE